MFKKVFVISRNGFEIKSKKRHNLKIVFGIEDDEIKKQKLYLF